MRVLFASVYPPSDTGDAYEHRLDSLRRELTAAGAVTDKVHLDLNSRRLGAVGQLSAAWSRVPWRDWDWVHVGGSVAPGLLGLQRRGRTGLVFDAHGLAHAEKAMSGPTGLQKLRVPAFRALGALSARQADLCVTVSRPMVDVLADLRNGYDGIHLVRNGVDIARFAPAPMPDGVFRVGYAGGFQPWQAVDLLVDAMPHLRDLVDAGRLRLRLVGFRPEEAALKASLARRLPEGTELMDRVPQEELVGLLHACHLLAIPRRPHPATRVALPTKFAEYLALQRPVLVNRVDESELIVREERCGFVADSAPEAVARAIREAVETPVGELAAMGERGRRFVATELDWRRIGEGYHRVLTEALAARA
ncbi:MAG: glycosyltransferase [Myxococcota bacterium]